MTGTTAGCRRMRVQMGYDLVPDRFPILRAGGLTLREMCEDDLPAWFGRLSDSEAARLAGDPVATSMQLVIDGLADHRKAFRSKEGLRWAIVPGGEDQSSGSIGSIGLGEFDSSRRSAAIGAAIGRVHWNRGVGTAAGRLVIDYGFEVLDLRCIEALVLAQNERVIAVLGKLGFQRVGPTPPDRSVGGPDDPSLLYVLRSE